MVRVGVLGAGGRMGQALIAVIAADPETVLAGAADRAGHPAIGTKVAPGVTVCTNASAVANSCDVLVDFTSPAALSANLEAACLGNCAIVVGTTGLEAVHHKMIDRAAATIAVLQAANTCLGVTLLTALVEQAAARLGPEWDIEIAELHHRHKIDSPSGTALQLGAAAARGRNMALDAVAVHGRHGISDPRAAGAIGFASMRGGSAAGDHMVLFAGDGERIELTHRAEGRDVFARGGVRAAAWLAGKPRGRYAMAQVLGF
jgi:4-hydroxy-tetrahydrodipicolinate reductase